MKNAIVMLCMLKDHYLMASCINAFINKALMHTYNIKDVELVMMCDDYIHDKYLSTMKKYFDKIVKVDLTHHEMIDTDKRKSENWFKKYGWVIYSLTKWQCLKLTEYNKILFLDVDILPASPEFYDIFNFDTPAFHLMSSNMPNNEANCVNNQRLHDIINYGKTYDEYIDNSKDAHYSIDGGLVLLRPSLEVYDDYIKFVNSISKDGIKQMFKSGIDETTLFFYYTKHKKEKEFYRICNDYVDIPWEENTHKYDKNRILKSYNYLSFIKPWKKAKLIAWDEECLWRDIYHKMIKTTKLKKLCQDTVVEGLEEFFSYENNFYLQKKYYNVAFKKRNHELFRKLNSKETTYKDILDAEKQLGIEKKNKDYGFINPKSIKILFKAIKKYKKERKDRKI
jgi:hypothetical protein